MKKKTIGIIGAGKHFVEKIFPVISNSNFFEIEGILRKSNRTFKNIPNFNENEFFKKSLILSIFVVQIIFMKIYFKIFKI